MTARETDRIVGFDRKIELEWLDAAAGWVAEGLPSQEVRQRLSAALEGEVLGSKARRNTVSVLTHVWVTVPPHLETLRDDGLEIRRERPRRGRLPLHWGMCAATYPFFNSVVSAAGRLIALHDQVALSQITRRTAEVWGDRSTVTRATQRIVRSLVLWGVLEELQGRGMFALGTPIGIPSHDPVGPWLAEASLSGKDRPATTLRGLAQDPALFPFRLELSAGALAHRRALSVHSEGVDGGMVVLDRSPG